LRREQNLEFDCQMTRNSFNRTVSSPETLKETSRFYRMRRVFPALILFAVFIFSLLFCEDVLGGLTSSARNYRYVVCTDMTHDNENSLIRLLCYANEIDIEAIIVTDQGPESNKIEDWPNKMWNRAFEIID